VTPWALLVVAQGNISVVSVTVFVILEAGTVTDPLGSIRLPDGSPLLSLSIRTEKSADGDSIFFKANLKAFHGTPVHIMGIDFLVLFTTSPILSSDVASAKDIISSGMSESVARTSSQRGNVSLSVKVSTDVDANRDASNCCLLTASFRLTAVGTIGDFKNVFIQSIFSLPVLWTTSASSALSVSILTTSSCMSFICSAGITRNTESPTSKL